MQITEVFRLDRLVISESFQQRQAKPERILYKSDRGTVVVIFLE